MRDIPIIFSAPMIRALLDGRKTMTRRLAWRLRDVGDNHTRTPTAWQKVKPGDRLWVREASHIDGRQVTYMADHPGDPSGLGWRPSIHMPRWASRLTLIVKATKIERVKDITMEDMIAEGLSFQPLRKAEHTMAAALRVCDELSPKWEKLWCDLHGNESWVANPWVVAMSFEVKNRNIDKLPK